MNLQQKVDFFVDFLWSDFFISKKQGKFRATTKNIKDMMNNNSTTNSEKMPIIDNDEALRLIDLIQQATPMRRTSWQNSVLSLSRLWQGSMWTRDSLTKNSLQPVVTECYVPATSSTSRVASSLPRMPYGGCAKLFCKRSAKRK